MNAKVCILLPWNLLSGQDSEVFWLRIKCLFLVDTSSQALLALLVLSPACRVKALVHSDSLRVSAGSSKETFWITNNI
jgi:hypothetical protein